MNTNKLTSELVELLHSAINKGAEITIKIKPYPQQDCPNIQIEVENEKTSLKEKKNQKKQPTEPTEQDKLTASRLLEIKQATQKTRKVDLKVWARDVMGLRKIKLEDHFMTEYEIEQAFIYAFQVNPFWSENGIIINPRTLLEHMKRTRKPTFKVAFINWIDKGGKLNDAHRSSDKKGAPPKSDPVREGFRMLGIEISESS